MEAIGQLTGGVAHDFNNLLAAVLGNLKLLRKRLGDDAAARRLIDGAIEGAERGASLTQRLLAFARQQDLHPARGGRRGADPRHARDAAPLDRPADPGRDGVRGRPLAGARRRQSARAGLLNLVVNARDAMPRAAV